MLNGTLVWLVDVVAMPEDSNAMLDMMQSWRLGEVESSDFVVRPHLADGQHSAIPIAIPSSARCRSTEPEKHTSSTSSFYQA